MIDKKVLEGVKALLQAHGKLICAILAEKMQMPPSSMIYFLRDAVDAGALTECNGFYDIPRPRVLSKQTCESIPQSEPVAWCEFRKSLPWIEGNSIPSLVKDFAMGVLTCESVYVVMELDEAAQDKGVPRFTFGYIDVRLGKFIDGRSGWNITSHILRYLVVDRSPKPERLSVSMEVV
ncbi:hypothetical protein DS657_06295 [Salmonella enterica subsp. enterica]|uniref:Gp11 C-terminal domain-containing protein n=1 Tax=Salmonella enterica TaxID=28901 RepID=A0A5T2WJ68_SALER|nr:hypothetical protein [Salmonella enterica subsp. enterica serovar Newport]EAM8418391.1 hypothetical protein [Salmonella enterica]EBY8597416.1 hypothetical protein [Salmonella enterica subsp. enterica serovar Newport]